MLDLTNTCTVWADNGNPPTSSSMQFTSAYAIHHNTSNPYYLQGNNFTERTVKMVKGILKKTVDPYIHVALLAYCTTSFPWCGLNRELILLDRDSLWNTEEKQKTSNSSCSWSCGRIFYTSHRLPSGLQKLLQSRPGVQSWLDLGQALRFVHLIDSAYYRRKMWHIVLELQHNWGEPEQAPHWRVASSVIFIIS